MLGQEIVKFEPEPLIGPEQFSTELAGIPAVFGLVFLKTWPIWATLIGGVAGLHFLSKEVEEVKPIFEAAVPLTLTGAGIWGAARLIPVFKPERADFPTEAEFESARRTYSIVSGFAWLGVTGLATWGIARAARVLKKKEEAKPPAAIPEAGYAATKKEVATLDSVLMRIDLAKLVILEPSFTLLEQTGWVWEWFKVRLRFKLKNNTGIDIPPGTLLLVEDEEKGFIIHERRMKAWPNGWSATITIVKEFSEWSLETNLPYADHIVVRVSLGVSRDRILQRKVFRVPTMRIVK
jgi:hypothetical protein